jgi:hypothetical protein
MGEEAPHRGTARCLTTNRAAYIRALVTHRCPEIEPADLALIGTIQPAAPSADNASTEAIAPPAEMLPVEIGERIVEVLDLMMGRLDDLALMIPAPIKYTFGNVRFTTYCGHTIVRNGPWLRPLF